METIGTGEPQLGQRAMTAGMGFSDTLKLSDAFA